MIAARTGAGGGQVESVQMEVVRYPDLPEARVAELVEELRSLHPRVLEFPRPAQEERRPEQPGEVKGSVSTRVKADGPCCTASSAYAASRIANAAVARRR